MNLVPANSNNRRDSLTSAIAKARLQNSQRENDDPTIKKEKVAYIVDAENGPYHTIQEAIDKAEEGGLIQVVQGLYIENLRIEHKSVTIEAKDITSEVYLMGAKGPTVYIEVHDAQKVTLQGLRMTHKSSKRSFQQYNLFNDKLLSKLVGAVEDYHIQYKKLNFDPDHDCVVYIEKGEVSIKRCLINLNLLVTET